MTQAPWQQTQQPTQGYAPQPGPQAPWQPSGAPQNYAGQPPQQPGPQQPPWQPSGAPQGYAGQPPAAPQSGPQPPQGGPAQAPWQQTPQAPPANTHQSSGAQDSGDDEFFTGGGGGGYMSFADASCIGHPRGGTIVGVNEQQQTNRRTKEPMFWPNSDRPIMIKVVTLQTNERKPGDTEDLGLRSVWLPAGKDVTKAVTEAIKASSPNEVRLKLGGQLWITRTGSRETTQKDGTKGFPAFTYTAQYMPPTDNPNDGFFAGNGTAPAPQGPPAQAPQTPWQQPGGQAPPQGNAYATGPNGQQGYQQPQYQGQQQQPPQYQGPPAPNGQQPQYQGQPQGYPPAAGQQPPWAQTPPQQQQWAQLPVQGGYQPPAPDPANPWGGQPGPQAPQGQPTQQYPQQ